jgi:hypothetical protein
MAANEKPAKSPGGEKETRLAEALRANLRRRKQAAPPKAPPRDEN